MQGALDDPSLGHDGEGVELVALGDVHGCAELVLDRVGKRPVGVAAIDEHIGDLLEVVRAAGLTRPGRPYDGSPRLS